MPMYNVAKRRGKAKIKMSTRREGAMRRLMDSYSEEFDVMMSVIQDLISLGIKSVA